MPLRIPVSFNSNIGQGRAPTPVILAVCIVLAGSLAGCATAIPLPSFARYSKDDVTGSINKTPVLSDKLDGEDLRRARGALSVALDPQGNGAPVAWANPQTNIKGSFVPVGQAWAKGDGICRTFLADLNGSHPQRQLQGTACRAKDGDWQISDVQPWKKSL